MSCFRSSGYNICISEAYYDHRKLFSSDTNFVSLVSNSHIAPAWWTAEFFSPCVRSTVLYSVLFPINVIFPSSSDFLSLLETFSIRASTTVTICLSFSTCFGTFVSFGLCTRQWLLKWPCSDYELGTFGSSKHPSNSLFPLVFMGNHDGPMYACVPSLGIVLPPTKRHSQQYMLLCLEHIQMRQYIHKTGKAIGVSAVVRMKASLGEMELSWETSRILSFWPLIQVCGTQSEWAHGTMMGNTPTSVTVVGHCVCFNTQCWMAWHNSPWQTGTKGPGAAVVGNYVSPFFWIRPSQQGKVGGRPSFPQEAKNRISLLINSLCFIVPCSALFLLNSLLNC